MAATINVTVTFDEQTNIEQHSITKSNNNILISNAVSTPWR